MKAYSKMEVQLHPFLTSALEGINRTPLCDRWIWETLAELWVGLKSCWHYLRVAKLGLEL